MNYNTYATMNTHSLWVCISSMVCVYVCFTMFFLEYVTHIAHIYTDIHSNICSPFGAAGSYITMIWFERWCATSFFFLNWRKRNRTCVLIKKKDYWFLSSIHEVEYQHSIVTNSLCWSLTIELQISQYSTGFLLRSMSEGIFYKPIILNESSSSITNNYFEWISSITNNFMLQH